MRCLCVAVVFILVAVPTHGQERESNNEAAPGRVDPGVAQQVAEVIRAKRAGIMVALFVKPGDSVTKNQVLGHTELDAARLSLDTARANLEATGTLDQMFWQHQALITTREEMEEAVHKRTAPKSRLQFTIAMEQAAKGQYQAQLDIEKVQQINLEHCQKEYEARFIHSPIDGVVSEAKVALGQAVGIGAPVFTVSTASHLSLPRAVQAEKFPVKAK
jgi:multidrug efflux pump subunit AcrA (membrane-fusion protein)